MRFPSETTRTTEPIVDSLPQRSPTTRRRERLEREQLGLELHATVGQSSEKFGRIPVLLEPAEEAAVFVDTHAEVEEYTSCITMSRPPCRGLRRRDLVMRHKPSRSRERWMITSSADAICSRIRADRKLDTTHQRHGLDTRQRGGLFECTVVSEPSWPVFIAWSMSSASAPRASPTITRSGRIRSELRTSSRILTSPWPSTFGGHASSEHTCCCRGKPEDLGVLDRDDAVVVGDERRHDVEQCRLPGTGTARDRRR